MAYKSKRSKATDISYKTKEIVWERDNYSCIYCGKTGYGVIPNAHFIPRSKGGLGIEQNIVTLCQGCHYKFDFGTQEQRSELRHFTRGYLRGRYVNWKEEDLVYVKGKL
ncbi:MAG: HNH endonuclease [Crenarchaeota archaeon]|nr:HNH endonuclease [Thermoproteota archaeon]